MPAPPKIVNRANPRRTRVGSMPKWAARPAQTPATTRPSRTRYSFLVPLKFGSFMPRSCPLRGREDIRINPLNTLILSRREELAMSAGTPGTDLLQIDDQLSDEERLIRDTVRAFAADRV